VYIAAYLLPAGRAWQAPRAPTWNRWCAQHDSGKGGHTCNLRAEVSDPRCSVSARCDYELALARLSPEPLKPLVTKLLVTAQRSARAACLRRVSQDRA